MAASDYINQVQSMYISYYGRFADQAGLNYWTYMLDANGGNLDGIIQAFGTSAEATALYPATLSTAQKVTNLYNSLFGRDPDAAGLTFYTNLIGSGQATLVDIAKRVFDGATAQDANMLANKTNAANTLTQSVGATANYSGDAAAATARALMSNITNDPASITPVQNVMGAAVTSAKTTGTAITTMTAATAAATGTTTSTTTNDVTPPQFTVDVAYANATALSLTSSETGYAGFYNNGVNVIGNTAVAAGVSTNLSVVAQGAVTLPLDVKIVDAAGNSKISATKVILGTAVADTGGTAITGTIANEIIFGFAGNDTIDGGAGDDTIDGGAGDDALTGGTGVDTFVINAGNDTIADLGQGGADVIVLTGGTVTAAVHTNWTATAATTNTVSTAAGAINTNARNVDLTLATGTFGWTVANTGTAATILGSAQNDSITAGTGADTITTGGGTDAVALTNTQNSIVNVNAGTANITGGGASQVFNVSAGATANVAVSTHYTATADTKSVGTATTTLTAADGININMSAATVTTAATDGFILVGGATGATLIGSAGNDTITGGAGVDIITGGAGADTINGQAGADTYNIAAGDSTSASMDELTYVTAEDIINFSTAAITLAANADAAGEATISAAGLVTAYNGAATAYDTFAEKLAQIDLAIGGTQGQAAVFVDAGQAYLYIAVGTDTTNDGTDVVVKLTGITTLATGITLSSGDISAIA